MYEVPFPEKFKEFDPKRLIGQFTTSKTANFILVLSLIFNDLKNLIVFDIQTSQRLKTITEKGKLTCELGELSGRRIHTQKLIYATLNELFKFIDKHEDVFNLYDFKEAYECLNREEKKSWDDIVDSARMTRPNGAEPYQNILWDIRNAGTYHYRDLDLSKSFTSFFESDVLGSKNACWNYAINYAQSRYFFADAAMQEKLGEIVNSKMDFNEFSNKNIIYIEKIVTAVGRIVKEYINKLPR